MSKCKTKSIISILLCVLTIFLSAVCFSAVETSAKAKKTSIFTTSKKYTPKKGDIVFFDWQNDKEVDHSGIVYKRNKNTIYTIEGNIYGIDKYHTKVGKVKYNYKKSKFIYGYIKTHKVVSAAKANKMASIALKEVGNKGPKYWNGTKCWGAGSAEWDSIFDAWVIEHVKSKPKSFGWNAYHPTWISNAKKIKK